MLRAGLIPGGPVSAARLEQLSVHFPGGKLCPETGCVGVYDVVERRTVQKCASLAGVELRAKTLTAKGSFQCAACATAQSKRSKPAQVTDFTVRKRSRVEGVSCATTWHHCT